MHQIERGIFHEDSYLGVTLGGLVFPHGIVMIDAPLRAEDGRVWRTTLVNQRSGVNRLMVNLDSHPDRTLGARAMDCTIMAHQKTAQVFRNRPTIFKGQTVETGAAWESYSDAVGMRWASPDITFTQQMSLHWGGPEVLLDYRPGPTPGSIWVVIPSSKIVFVGDTVVINQPPFLANAEMNVWLESLELLMSKSYEGFTVISGRGGLCAFEDIRSMYNQLQKIDQSIERLGKHNGAPEATEELIVPFLAESLYPKEKLDVFTHRLRYGLYQYFARRFRPASSLEQPRLEDAEQ